MTAHPIIRSSFVAALAAWILLCCCERRIYADTLLGALGAGLARCAEADRPAPACCSHCASEEGGGPNGDPDHPPELPCCGNGCCDKAAAPAVDFVIAIDTVGVAVEFATPIGAMAPAPDRARGVRDGHCRPPPWRVLIETARLRI
ncbi:MAG: hypothetical protein ACKOYN_02075 [Planctomycetota bacterium]